MYGQEVIPLEKTSVQKLARVLRVMVVVVFVCSLAALVLVPFFVESRFFYRNIDGAFLDGVLSTFAHDFDDGLAIVFDTPFYLVWQHPYTAILTVFLWACDICTAIILWQAKRVLDTILKGETFTFGNAANMKRAAVCCFVISGAAMARTVWGLVFYRSVAPLLTYNFLFVPVFLMAGLLCMVMSALFRQAAEMKAEQDLTI